MDSLCHAESAGALAEGLCADTHTAAGTLRKAGGLQNVLLPLPPFPSMTAAPGTCLAHSLTWLFFIW